MLRIASPMAVFVVFTLAPSAPSISSAQSLPLHTAFLKAPATVPTSSTDPLVGRYRLDIEAGSRSGPRCEAMPEAMTRRSYVADIHDLGGRRAVRLFEAAFLTDTATVAYGCNDPRLPQSGYSMCHQFLLTGDPSALTLTVTDNDEWRGSEIWEGVPNGFLLAITGQATGAARDGRIEAVGKGGIWYGNGLPAPTFHACQSAALRFTFTRQ